MPLTLRTAATTFRSRRPRAVLSSPHQQGKTRCNRDDPSSNGLGNYVTIQHTNKLGSTFTTYAHLADGSVTVKKNERLVRGAQIGVMGKTGCADGPHLHFVYQKCVTIFSCSEWNDPDPAPGDIIKSGTPIPNSTYPGVGPAQVAPELSSDAPPIAAVGLKYRFEFVVKQGIPDPHF
jgi:murein DD-endopeptidase MepM/ murein hydrolase activator NlpD